MAKKYFNVGSMIAKRDKNSGEAILDDNKKQTYYVKIDKDSSIVVNGKEVTNGYINISRPRDKFDKMLENGKLTPKEHAEKIARYEKGGDLDYIQFELNVTVED